jgi:glycosyltransferase involved in cell wall biosynthesis
MPGPRVAYILLWFPEPSQTFILDEVNTLAQLGLDLQVYTLYGERPPSRVAGMGQVLAPVHRLGISRLGLLLRDAVWQGRKEGRGAAFFLARVLGRRWRSLETAGEALWATLAGIHLARRFLADGIHHIHAPWADGPATAAWVAGRLSGIPFSFCAHAHDIYPPDGALAEKMAAAAFVRTISRANRDYLASLAPLEARKIVKISYGAPLAGESRPPRPSRVPHRLLAIGRFVPKKGFPVLLQALSMMAKRKLDCHLTLAGDGPERPYLLALARELGLTGRVAFPGFIPHRQVPELLREADLFVLPCRIAPGGDRDGIPNVILEALAHQVPVVGTDVSGLAEAIRPGETGWLVPPEDPAALARAMEEALLDPEEARRRAQAGRELIRREFDSRKNYGQLLACFGGPGLRG